MTVSRVTWYVAPGPTCIGLFRGSMNEKILTLVIGAWHDLVSCGTCQEGALNEDPRGLCASVDAWAQR